MTTWHRTLGLVASLALSAGVARAASPEVSGPQVSGSGALAVAALVGLRQPTLAPASRRVLAWLLEGRTVVGIPTVPIVVEAAAVTCRAGNVDITFHECRLDFGGRTQALTGRAANELFATLIVAGVKADGAAGSIDAGVTGLSCTVDPKAIARKDGGGADCRFKPSN